MPYDFSPELRAEMDAFATDDMSTCRDEMVIAKLLLKRAVEAGNSGLANALLSTIAKLHATNLSAQIRTGNLIGIGELSRLGQLLAAALTKRLSGAPGFEQLADVILDDWAQIFTNRQNLLTLEVESSEVPRSEATLLHGHIVPTLRH